MDDAEFVRHWVGKIQELGAKAQPGQPTAAELTAAVGELHLQVEHQPNGGESDLLAAIEGKLRFEASAAESQIIQGPSQMPGPRKGPSLRVAVLRQAADLISKQRSAMLRPVSPSGG